MISYDVVCYLTYKLLYKDFIIEIYILDFLILDVQTRCLYRRCFIVTIGDSR